MIALLLQDSLGKRLHDARSKRGLNVADAAFQTHIPSDKIRELENDDYSNFANLTYAKSFLRLYANHLELDISEQLKEFHTANGGLDEPSEYLIPSGTPSYAEMAERQKMSPALLTTLKVLPMVAMLSGIVWLCVWLYKQKDLRDDLATTDSKVIKAEMGTPQSPKPMATATSVEAANPAHQPSSSSESLVAAASPPAEPLSPKAEAGTSAPTEAVAPAPTAATIPAPPAEQAAPTGADPTPVDLPVQIQVAQAVTDLPPSNHAGTDVNVLGELKKKESSSNSGTSSGVRTVKKGSRTATR